MHVSKPLLVIFSVQMILFQRLIDLLFLILTYSVKRLEPMSILLFEKAHMKILIVVLAFSYRMTLIIS